MIGLVIIVILITLGMLFLAQFSLKERPEKKIFTMKGLAFSAMSALMRTTIDCGISPQTMNSIFQDCAGYPDYQSLDSINHCERKHSCQFAREKVELLLQKTLGTWNKKYEFHSRFIRGAGERPEDLFGPGTPIIMKDGGCPGERDSSGLLPISVLDAGLIENELYVCD